MRAVCQRVSQARVRVAGEIVAEIGSGLCVLLGVGRGDAGGEAARLAGKVARLRVFPDAAGRFDREGEREPGSVPAAGRSASLDAVRARTGRQ